MGDPNDGPTTTAAAAAAAAAASAAAAAASMATSALSLTEENGVPHDDMDGPSSLLGVGPPSPLTGCYLLIILGEPHSIEHKDIIVQKLLKGLTSWNIMENHVDLEEELNTITAHAPDGEIVRHGERLIQYASENLVTEILIHPQYNTLIQCMRNLLSSFTRHRHIIHAGYTFSGNGSWILQDGTFSVADFSEAFQENEVQRVLRAYPDTVSMDIHCESSAGLWNAVPNRNFAKSCKIRINPADVLNAGSDKLNAFIDYLAPMLVPASLTELLECSDVVGNIRFSHPTLYVFPGGQGDAALFGINGFNMLVDGGFNRKACFWDFARHLDRLDAVLMTRINNSNIQGMASVIERKYQSHVYPQIGHFFCNVPERKSLDSPQYEKDKDSLIVDIMDTGHRMVTNLQAINLKPQTCYRDIEPMNLYHKVGHGTLDMYVISPSKDSKEVREFMQKWTASDQKLFAARDTKDFQFPIQNLVSICALLVWQPANPDDTITRILFPGSTPDYKIIEGLEKIKHLEFMKHPMCTAKKLVQAVSTSSIAKKPIKSYTPDTTIPDSIVSSKIAKALAHEAISDNKEADKESKLIEEQAETEKKAIMKSKAKKIIPKKVESMDEKKTDELPEKKDAEDDKPEKKDADENGTEIIETGGGKKDEPDAKPKLKKTEPKPKTDTAKTAIKSKIDSKPPKSMDRKPIKRDSTEKKDTIGKSSPTTTPKREPKVTNGYAKEREVKSKIISRATKSSPSSTPAKSAKEANNRKVLESKTKAFKKQDPTKPPIDKKDSKVERKPISHRTKGISPSRKAHGSPIKSAKPKTEKDSILRKAARLDKGGTTDSSLVSTPSADESAISKKLVDISVSELDPMKQRELDDLKEEQEAVREIEAVFKRDEKAKKKDLLDDHREIIKQDSATEAEDEEEYLIIEKEEVEQYTEDSINEQESSMTKEEEIQKHLRDSQESEKKRKTSLEVTEEEVEPKEDKKIVKHIDIDEKVQDDADDADLQPDSIEEIAEKPTKVDKEDIQEEVQEIITSAKAIVKAKSDSREEIVKTEETLSQTPEDKLSSTKKTTDTKDELELLPEAKDGEVQNLPESQPFSATIESGATTAPTLPEDERIPLDKIKEDLVIEEKYVKEETKETDVSAIPPKVHERVERIVPTRMHFDVQHPHLRDIVKTPDEVADLPVHEEADIGEYTASQDAQEEEKEMKDIKEEYAKTIPAESVDIKIKDIIETEQKSPCDIVEHKKSGASIEDEKEDEKVKAEKDAVTEPVVVNAEEEKKLPSRKSSPIEKSPELPHKLDVTDVKGKKDEPAKTIEYVVEDLGQSFENTLKDVTPKDGKVIGDVIDDSDEKKSTRKSPSPSLKEKELSPTNLGIKEEITKESIEKIDLLQYIEKTEEEIDDLPQSSNQLQKTVEEQISLKEKESIEEKEPIDEISSTKEEDGIVERETESKQIKAEEQMAPSMLCKDNLAINAHKSEALVSADEVKLTTDEKSPITNVFTEIGNKVEDQIEQVADKIAEVIDSVVSDILPKKSTESPKEKSPVESGKVTPKEEDTTILEKTPIKEEVEVLDQTSPDSKSPIKNKTPEEIEAARLLNEIQDKVEESNDKIESIITKSTTEITSFVDSITKEVSSEIKNISDQITKSKEEEANAEGFDYSHQYPIKTTELRETHITTLDSPVAEKEKILDLVVLDKLPEHGEEEPDYDDLSTKTTASKYPQDEYMYSFEREDSSLNDIKEEEEDCRQSPTQRISTGIRKASEEISDIIKQTLDAPDLTDRPRSVSPREEEVLKIVANVAEVLKSEKDIAEIIPDFDEEELERKLQRISPKPDDDSTTVQRMLVTASSEDGGEETEICAEGSIKFSPQSVTPDIPIEISIEDDEPKDIIDTKADKLSSTPSTPDAKTSSISFDEKDKHEIPEKVQKITEIEIEPALQKEIEPIRIIKDSEPKTELSTSSIDPSSRKESYVSDLSDEILDSRRESAISTLSEKDYTKDETLTEEVLPPLNLISEEMLKETKVQQVEKPPIKVELKSPSIKDHSETSRRESATSHTSLPSRPESIISHFSDKSEPELKEKEESTEKSPDFIPKPEEEIEKILQTLEKATPFIKEIEKDLQIKKPEETEESRRESVISHVSEKEFVESKAVSPVPSIKSDKPEETEESRRESVISHVSEKELVESKAVSPVPSIKSDKPEETEKSGQESEISHVSEKECIESKAVSPVSSIKSDKPDETENTRRESVLSHLGERDSATLIFESVEKIKSKETATESIMETSILHSNEVLSHPEISQTSKSEHIEILHSKTESVKEESTSRRESMTSTANSRVVSRRESAVDRPPSSLGEKDDDDISVKGQRSKSISSIMLTSMYKPEGFDLDAFDEGSETVTTTTTTTHKFDEADTTTECIKEVTSKTTSINNEQNDKSKTDCELIQISSNSPGADFTEKVHSGKSSPTVGLKINTYSLKMSAEGLSGRSTPDIADIDTKSKVNISKSPIVPLSPTYKADFSHIDSIAPGITTPKDYSGKSSPFTHTTSDSKSIPTSLGHDTSESSPKPTSPFPKGIEEMKTSSGMTTPDMTRTSTPDCDITTTSATITTTTTVVKEQQCTDTQSKLDVHSQKTSSELTDRPQSKSDISSSESQSQRTIKENQTLSKEITSIKSEFISYTPGVDDFDMHDVSSPRSDISSSQVSRVVTESESHVCSDDEIAASPFSAASQAPHSPSAKFSYDSTEYELQRSSSGVSKKSDLDMDDSQNDMPPEYGSLEAKSAISIASSYKADPMSTSVYGTLPESFEKSEPIPIASMRTRVSKQYEEFTSSGPETTSFLTESRKSIDHKFLDEADLDFEKAMEEHRKCIGSEVMTSVTSKYEYSPSKSALKGAEPSTDFLLSGIQKSKLDSGLLASTSTTDQSPQSSTTSIETNRTSDSGSHSTAAEKDDIDERIASWGKPLGLPSPALYTGDSQTTPKKERRIIMAKTKLNNEKNLRKRSESPVKQNRKPTPIYMDLTYVPHNGNSYYAHVEFFKRVRARYYVFSGTEPSRDVYNALLEAKQTWEDKDLEVTIIPTYDTDVLGYWVSENEDLLTKYHIDLSPSASRCTINLQDHETSCSAYRLEF